MAKSAHRLSCVRFSEPIELHQTKAIVQQVDAKDGWLICNEVSGWVWIRLYKDGKWLDRGATWVESRKVVEAIPYEYPEHFQIDPAYPDWLYPEKYP